MPEPPSERLARLVVCDPGGAVVGGTPEFTVPSPYWAHVEPLVTAARERLGITVTVLRLLSVQRASNGGLDRTSYLVESTAPGSLSPATREDRLAVRPHPLRMPWAEPGGPAAQLTWATERLAARGIRLIAPAVQVRTWNLSSIWRLPTSAGMVWLKAVPPFFAHEASAIRRFDGYAVPTLLAGADGICLLADIAGQDLYEAGDEHARAMIDALIAIQRGPGSDIDALRAIGLPDWRVSALAEPFAHLLAVRGDEVDREERRVLEALMAALDARERELQACGIPDALVHGDFHPGNARGEGADVTILDWGDSGIGHPMLDLAAFTQWMTQRQRMVVEAHWAQRWRSEVPGSDPVRAAELVAPLAALRQAVIYRHFLDHIEADERIYHETDDLLWLRRTAALLDDPGRRGATVGD